MAGHSKWANIKHRKGAQDAKKGKIFQKLAREIFVAARKGSSLENNSTLRLVVAKARSFNMPKDRIQAAIDKGSGVNKNTTSYVELIYEATGHKGALMIIEALSDKPTRTSPIIKSILVRHGWNLVPHNSALYAFKRGGRIIIQKSIIPLEKMEDIVLETCANDFVYDEDYYVIYCLANDLEKMQKELLNGGIKEFSDISKGLFPTIKVTLKDKHLTSFENLLNKLDDTEDVINVYHNVI